MHDHLGGGFHRYSVDAFWHVPHFEKMLYDQAQLAVAYLDAFQITRDLRFEAIARDILDYVRRDMTDRARRILFRRGCRQPDRTSGQAPRKPKAPFMFGRRQEIDDALGDVWPNFSIIIMASSRAATRPQAAIRRANSRGKTFSDRAADASRKRRNISKKTKRDVAESCAISPGDASGRSRTKRPRPHLDDKIITAWNGLMISAFARGGAGAGRSQITSRPRHGPLTFVRDNSMTQRRILLRRSYRAGPAEIGGFAEDYAFSSRDCSICMRLLLT